MTEKITLPTLAERKKLEKANRDKVDAMLRVKQGKAAERDEKGASIKGAAPIVETITLDQLNSGTSGKVSGGSSGPDWLPPVE
jgi:hypothetical protein